MSENPLERLNYYNGMQLSASDFKTEQDYHIRTRRWLNKSLYSAGIARGLEVRPVPGTRVVTVSPGLALDNEGREIIVLEQVPVEVRSYPGTDDSTVVGNYLVVEYAEEAIAYERGGCAVRTKDACASKSTTHWGGPSRIQAQVKFSWVQFVPQPGSNQIVLARVELDSTCSEVLQIDSGTRRYIGGASANKVRQYALEGEREVACLPKDAFPDPKPIDCIEVVGRIYFHIRGRPPNSVTLYLRAEPLSRLYYSEIGQHSHTTSGSTNIPDHVILSDSLSHIHQLSNVITDVEKQDDVFNNGSPHNHNIRASFAGPFDGRPGKDRIQLAKNTNPPAALGFMRHRVDYGNSKFIIEGEHRHRLISDGPVGESEPAYTDTPVKDRSTAFTLTLKHSSPSEQPTIDATGARSPARTNYCEPLEFVDDLRISIGQVVGGQHNLIDLTDDIMRQILDAEPNWSAVTSADKKIGNGTSSHPFAIAGTGAIRLDFLPRLVFSEGAYCLELRIRKDQRTIANGGKVLYSLYIE